jgi:hypothetical protein
MNGAIPLLLAALLYLWSGAAYLLDGKFAMAVMVGAYAVANIALAVVAR